jgi:predicted Zn-dependent peptidase
MVSYSDTGLWSVYFGCDHQDVKRCLQLVRKELNKLMHSPVSSRQLKIAKQQIKGQIAIACDHRENFALDFGKSFLHDGWEKNVEKLYAQIDAVTAEQLQQVALELFTEEKIRTLIYR